MDDFRRRYDVPRRNYGMPGRPQPAPRPATARPHPQHQPPAAPHHIPGHPPHSRPAPVPAAAEPLLFPDLDPLPATHPAPPRPAAKRSKPALPRIAAGGLAAAALLAVGFAIYLKPAKAPSVLPSDLAKKASFSLYYPSALPGGYVYEKTISTFQGGQAYYMLSKGTKHIVVHEQSSSSDTLDTGSITNPQPLQTALGKAAIGTNSGQAAAAVLARSTLINITSNGYVPAADITTLISNLKNLSQGQ